MEMSPLEFLSQVYGVQEIILPKENAQPIAETPSAEFVFTLEMTTQEFESSYQTLFEKIITAMGLNRQNISVHLAGESLAVGPKTKACISFGGHQGDIGWNKGTVPPVLYVHSLQEMTLYPELKKLTWGWLKDITRDTAV
jgi:hypothetical protein